MKRTYRRVRQAMKRAVVHADKYKMKGIARQRFLEARRRKACRDRMAGL